MLQTRVPRGAIPYGFLNGRRRSVWTADQRHPSNRCLADADHHVHAGRVDGSGVRGKDSNSTTESEGNPSERQSRTIVIQVLWRTNDQQTSVKLNQEDVRWEDLETRLAQIYVTRAEKVAFVRGDADVDFQYVASVIDVAHHAGVERIGLLTNDQHLQGE